MSENTVYIYGRHAVVEALNTKPEVIRKVFLIENTNDERILNSVKRLKIESASFSEKNLPGDLHRTVNHQGVIAEIAINKLMIPYKEFIASLDITADTGLLILGEVQDPHNVGAVIRSAAAFGISGVLIPPHQQAPVTGTVIKVSAGMAFKIPVVAISNVNAVARDLKKKGFWVYGLEGGGEVSVSEEKYDRPSAFILGNEATGLREKTREVCDTLVSIPIHPRCESMNAAASTAVALYSWSVQHPNALK